MVLHKVFGAEVDIDIPCEVFPTKEEMDEDEKTMEGGEHGWFESSFEEAKLHYRYWLPKGDLKGILVFAHGISSNCGKGLIVGKRRLATSLLIDSMVGNGIALYSFEYYGHGYSEGTRFLIPKSWEYNKKDYINFCNLVAEKHPKDIPFFISGESYGGCLSIHVAKHFQTHPEEGPSNFDCLLLTAPAIIGDLPPFPVFQILRYLLAPYFPKWVPFFMPNPISPDRIWRDEEVRKLRTDKRYLEKGLEGGGQPFRLGTALNLVLAMESVREEAIPGLAVPFCIIHGTEDAGVPIEGSHFMMKNSATPDDLKELHLMEGAYHDMFTDPSAEESIGRWVSFINKRLQKS